MQKILIAIDDGPSSEKVATLGFQLGKQLKAEIALVSIADSAHLMTDGGITPQELAESILNDYKKNQEKLIDTVFKNQEVVRFVENGKPFEGIIKIAEQWGANIIVAGTHSRSGLSHLLMGSVAEKLIQHSTLPLFIIPNKL